ncbi:hypothetical protein [Xanthobacter flavus]|uniref:hypothetical protein n=1 Tax=Xanthobacter flavus TaxID=281 RepID=UPI00372B2FE3
MGIEEREQWIRAAEEHRARARQLTQLSRPAGFIAIIAALLFVSAWGMHPEEARGTLLVVSAAAALLAGFYWRAIPGMRRDAEQSSDFAEAEAERAVGRRPFTRPEAAGQPTPPERTRPPKPGEKPWLRGTDGPTASN